MKKIKDPILLNLDKAIRQSGVKLKHIEEKLGMSKPNLWKIRVGQIKLSTSMLKAICEIIHVSPADILKTDEDGE